MRAEDCLSVPNDSILRYLLRYYQLIGSNDYHLIRKVIDGLLQFKASPYLARLLRLLIPIQRLGETPIHNTDHRRRSQNTLTGGGIISMGSPNPILVNINHATANRNLETGLAPDLTLPPFPGVTSAGDAGELWEHGGENVAPYPTAGRLMWHLFHS
ncbi:hypothetical protein BBP40_009992 [Aspergillus hancockii]|nr:hypothetical protein BBP40_009992 [Aspergillus hancockii]